jgi:tetratricopeptide (TPR) repeat protein
MLIPPGHRFIEKKLRFTLTPRIRTVAASALFFASVPVSSHYDKVDRQAALQVKQAEERSAREKEIAAQKDRQRKDSLAWYLQQSRRLASARKLNDANQVLQNAQAFVVTPEERDEVANQQVGIKSITALDKVKAGKYEDALSEIEGLLLLTPSNRELQYNKALCKSKMGNIQEAVTDLKPLIAAEYPDAVKLHDKINPVRKRAVGTCTRCCDGSTSYATGRGACSHHGGVCNWNEPIYEESRKYE